MRKLFIEELPIQGKKVLMRVDFNVPLDNDLNITDPTRIEAALESIQYVLKQGGALILMSHLGRPKNAPNPNLSLKPIAKMLSALLEREVKMAPDCIGSEVEEMADKLKPEEVILLENLRFHRAEEHPEEDIEFAKTLASYGDLYVNDAFGTAHRKHSSTYTITQFFPEKAAAGYLLKNEISFLGETLSDPKRPFYAILGGAKISTKIGVIQSLLKKADHLFIGGAMAYTFFKAQGYEIGDSPFEAEFLPLAKELIGKNITLPQDLLCAKECSEDAKVKLINIENGIPQGYQGFDIGPKTIELFSQKLKEAKTILWNGPLGVYELETFAKGTYSIANAISNMDAIKIVGGGDLIAALNRADLADKMTHISTGGGATLEYIEYGTLPGIEALSDR